MFIFHIPWTIICPLWNENSAISLIVESTRSAHLAPMEIARKGSTLLSYDPIVRFPLWPSIDEARNGIINIWNEAYLIEVIFLLFLHRDLCIFFELRNNPMYATSKNICIFFRCIYVTTLGGCC